MFIFDVELGYVAVRQDMRGTGQSQGNFSLWQNEADDAYGLSSFVSSFVSSSLCWTHYFPCWMTFHASSHKDTMTWIANQTWCNGSVFEVGASADGLNSFIAVLADPQWLRAQFVIFASSVGKCHVCWVFVVVSLTSHLVIDTFHLLWSCGLTGYPIFYPGGAYQLALVEKWLNGTVPSQAAQCIQLVKEHEVPSPWWERLNLTGHYQNVDFPSVMWAGW